MFTRIARIKNISAPLDKQYTVRYNISMDNRENIIERAVELFSTRGYDAVGVQEIAETCGITKPTLYHYFGSKKGLLDAVLKEGFAGFMDTLKSAGKYAHDITKSLTDTANAFFTFARKNPDFYRMALSLYFSPPMSEANIEAALYHQEIYDIMEKMFLGAEADHGNMKGRRKEYAASFIGLLNTYIGMYLNGHTEFSDEMVYKIIHRFMHGIFS